ncbi:Alpha/beta hydrolase fold-1 [Massariosphaeria phaeospora]|uniref:Alpha/beta hydrolase fold-1 n=1 Tax=Massariosphaeria phaeospora TaxID=100035 RepID=A0A7C8I8S4_9PLEO|nr:Alpha/beta hydrolase fold-1 [Massariosphaeria phaeospora]
MTTLSNLAVVVCHGSYHSPAPYMPLVDALKAAGIDAYCPQLPTSNLAKLNVGDVNHPDFDLGPPTGGYPQGEQDAEVILGILKPLVEEQGKNVILIGHSSGGWVATQAAQKELQAEERARNKLSGGIIGVLYVGAFIIPVGESIHSYFQPKDGSALVPPFMKFHKHGMDGLGTMVKPETFLFGDVDADTAQKYVPTLTACPILTSKLTNDNVYSELPCAYLVLDADMTLPKEYQEGMVAAQVARSKVPFKTYHSPSGHSPHVSWTEGMVDVVQDFSKSVTA